MLWQYVYAKVPPRDEAAAFAETIRAFDPPFVFIDVEGEYERADSSVSGQYAEAFRTHLPHTLVVGSCASTCARVKDGLRTGAGLVQ